MPPVGVARSVATWLPTPSDAIHIDGRGILTSCSTLYAGQNSRGTSVFTWVAPRDETNFDEDVSPLLQYLWRKKLVSADARLGLVEFGSEAYHSGANVTFSASEFSMQLLTGHPPKYELNPIGDGCEKPVSPPAKEGGTGGKARGDVNGVLLLTTGVAFSVVLVGGGCRDSLLWLAAAVALRLYLV